MQELPVISSVNESTSVVKKPNWLRVKLPTGENYRHVRDLVDTHKLHTICESGNCPNMGECWGEGTATFMILGNVCTRSCGFCAVATGRPDSVDWDEPQRVAEAIYLMKVKHAVLTSVDRDELKDGGSIIWHNTIKAVKALNADTTLETLIPDFKGKAEDIQRIIDAAPEVVSHNIETVERLTRQVRIQAKYRRSMEVLKILKQGGMRTKSGIMCGLGETKEEVLQTMQPVLARSVSADSSHGFAVSNFPMNTYTLPSNNSAAVLPILMRVRMATGRSGIDSVRSLRIKSYTS
jgi:lipoic acid synthetase